MNCRVMPLLSIAMLGQVSCQFVGLRSNHIIQGLEFKMPPIYCSFRWHDFQLVPGCLDFQYYIPKCGLEVRLSKLMSLLVRLLSKRFDQP